MSSAAEVEPVGFKAAIEQMAAVGMEMIIMSFGTNFDPESTNTTYLQDFKQLVDYAKSKNIEVLCAHAEVCCYRPLFPECV